MVTVNDYAALSAAVYGNAGVGNASNTGWIRLQNYQDPETGFFAALFDNGKGERVLAFRGTEPWSILDAQTDAAVMRGEVPKQFNNALDIYDAVAKQYGTDGLSLTGHSLGGALASYVAAKTKDTTLDATVFNSLGVGKIVPSGDYPNVKNYNKAGDPATLFGPPQIGEKHSIEDAGLSIPNMTGLGILAGLGWYFFQNHRIDPMVGADFRDGRTTHVDPLALDLDGDGLETTGIGSNPILFDFNGDGAKTGTGWLKGDDAFLVLDRNGNGTIDNGGELFGIDTVLSNGQKAANGFAALADLDSNHDGLFSALDAQYANVKIWRDLNQDGISQSNELTSLSAAGIASINLSSTATNIALAGGNVQTAAGSYTRTNGQSGSVGTFTTANLNLVSNPFYSDFTDHLPLTDAAKALPAMQGSGMVRDLQEAASLDATLVGEVNGFAGMTRSQMMSAMDNLLADWSATSTMKTSLANAPTRGFTLA